MQTDTREKFSPLTIGLHWIVGLGIIGLLGIGLYMSRTETWALYAWHKSFGVIIFAFVLLRVLWRLRNGWPQTLGDYPRHERMLARAVQITLLTATVLMPISGFAMSALSGHGVAVFGMELVARNPDPLNAQDVIAHNEQIAGLAHEVHEWVAYLLIAALCLHVAGGLKHHLLDKDGTLRRMLGARV